MAARHPALATCLGNTTFLDRVSATSYWHKADLRLDTPDPYLTFRPEPNGLLGKLKEAVASSSTLAKAKSDPGANQLIKAVVAHFETKEGRAAVQEALRKQLAGAKKPGDVVQSSLANLKEVSAILNAKAPQDAAGFKAWLQTMSKNVAEASSEGGSLGIGGVQVSDAEKATLADISKALGTSA